MTWGSFSVRRYLCVVDLGVAMLIWIGLERCCCEHNVLRAFVFEGYAGLGVGDEEGQRGMMYMLTIVGGLCVARG